MKILRILKKILKELYVGKCWKNFRRIQENFQRIRKILEKGDFCLIFNHFFPDTKKHWEFLILKFWELREYFGILAKISTELWRYDEEFLGKFLDFV